MRQSDCNKRQENNYSYNNSCDPNPTWETRHLRISDSDLNFLEHQFIPQTVVAHNPSAELGLLSPDSEVKQSPLKRRGNRTQDLGGNQRKMEEIRTALSGAFSRLY